MSDIFVTRKIPKPGLDLLEKAGVDYTVFQDKEDAGLTKKQLLAGVKDCQVLLCLLTEPVDKEVLSANPGLLGVAQMAVGFNNIDIDAATKLGIPVSNTPGVLTDTTADSTWAMILSVARNIPQAHNYMVAGKYKIWGPNLFLGGDVGLGASGNPKTLGIIGYGRIGEAVAKRAVGFDMRVFAYDPYARDHVDGSKYANWMGLDQLLQISDFISLHPLLTPETHHLINEERLKKMKPTAYLINASRGPVVDEAALVKALQEGWIAGAALDVFEEEPAMHPGLSELDNVVVLPHIASASRDTRGRMATMSAENALAFLKKQRALNPVNAEVYQSKAYQKRIGG